MSGELGGNGKWQLKQVIEDHNKELKQLENLKLSSRMKWSDWAQASSILLIGGECIQRG